MKKCIYILALLPMLLSGCNYLDQDPEQLNTLDKVFSTRNETLKWFYRMYSNDYFPNDCWGSAYYNHYMFGSDDANNALDWHIPALLNGSISPENPNVSTEYYWFGRYYQAIRHCNIFLENIDKCTELGIVEQERMIAEATFMRAIYHWWILREYGPIPIVEHSFISEKRARNTYDECIKWIIAEIDKAIPNMYEDRIEDDYGYPTKGAAMAMKSRILLYAASPLANGNPTYANWKNPDGTVLMPQKYDAEKWKNAAEAAKAVIDMKKYTLLTPQNNPNMKLEGEPTFNDYVNNYMDITTQWNDEVIWARPQATSWWTMQCLPACFYSWNARDAVTLEMANAYFMADGTVAQDLEKWFEDKQWSSQAGNGTEMDTFMMFVGREPRFYASTFFPNQRVSYATSAHPGVYETIEFWYEGNAGLSVSSGDQNSTGLSPRKNIPRDAQSNKEEGKCTSRNIPFPVIRLAEIYLNYCEAMNEYYGPSCHADILPYLNAVRERAGIPGYTGTYTKEQMREMLMQERRVEFAWECHRYFDVRRWFIAHGDEGVFNVPVHGLNVAEGQNATDPAFFTMKEGMVRIFRMEHYIMPLRAAECAYNSELVQAPFY